ncbi:MAG: exosortase [Oceanicoccus sp.]
MATYTRFGFISALFCFIFYPTLSDLFDRWIQIDGSQSHGIVIVALFATLFTEKLKTISAPSTRPFYGVGITALSLCSVSWYISANLNIEIFEQTLLLPIILFLCWSLMGMKAAVSLLPIITMLIFSIPVWNYLTVSLVNLSSDVVGFLVGLSGITAFIDGSSIYLTHGRIYIAEGCSGLRYLTISLALAYYLILTSTTHFKTNLKLILSAIALGLITNWLRIYIIVMVAHYSQMENSLVEDHEAFGWILFICVSAPFFFFVKTLPKAVLTEPAETSKLKLPLTLLSIPAMIIGPALYLLTNPENNTTPIKDWTQFGYQEMVDGEHLQPYKHPDSQLNLIKNEGTTTTELAIHWRQSQQDDMVPYVGDTFNGSHWRIVSTEIIDYADHTAKLSVFRQQSYGQFACTLSWYSIGHFDTPHYYQTKILQIPSSIINANSHFVAVVITREIDNQNCQKDKQSLINTAIDIHKELQQLLD